ncbi:MAG: hypothetical protein HY226_02460 [Candidatus Vogelbacteria bacterium]|nr:hypothetical protein [Candidatus Vogelbacteria bacterium]
MHVLVVDIGSGSAGLALVFLKKGSAPTIKYSIRQDIPFQKVPSAGRLLYLTLKSLRALVLQYQRDGNPNPDKIDCYLSSHLLISQTRIVKLQFDTPRRINRSLIDSMINGELVLFKSENATKYKERSVVVDNKLMSVKLNGYNVDDIDSRSVKELELAVFFTLVSESIDIAIRHTIADCFHHANLETHSFLFSSFSVYRDLFKENKDFVFIDIGGEVTDISLVKDGILESSSSFSSGKNNLIRQVTKRFGDERLLADSVLNIYSEGGMNERFKELLRPVFDDFGREWSNKLKFAIDKLASNKRLPDIFYILSDADVAALFQTMLASTDLSGKLLLNKSPDIKTIINKDFERFYLHGNNVVSDVFLTMGALFSNKIFYNLNFKL